MSQTTEKGVIDFIKKDTPEPVTFNDIPKGYFFREHSDNCGPMPHLQIKTRNTDNTSPEGVGLSETGYPRGMEIIRSGIVYEWQGWEKVYLCDEKGNPVSIDTLLMPETPSKWATRIKKTKEPSSLRNLIDKLFPVPKHKPMKPELHMAGYQLKAYHKIHGDDAMKQLMYGCQIITDESGVDYIEGLKI